MGDVDTSSCFCLKAAARVLLLVTVLTISLSAQTTSPSIQLKTPTTFWSQVDTYVGLTPSIDFMFLAAGSPGRDGTHPELVLGPNLNIALWNFLTHLNTKNPERNKYLTFGVGYRYVKNLYGPSTDQNVGIVELTPRFPLPFGFQLGDRNRIDLRGLPRQFTWRYRNRVTLSHSVAVKKFITTPYGQIEVFYDCKTGAWTHYAYRFGTVTRVRPSVEIDTWYRREEPITNAVRAANAAGVKLLLFLHNYNQ